MASHPVAPVQLDKGLLALPALSHQRLGHHVLDVGPLGHFVVVLDFCAPLGDVADFVAQPAALLSAVWVLAAEDLQNATKEWSTS